MLPPASVADNVVACHSAEHPCGASALRGLLERHKQLSVLESAVAGVGHNDGA